MTTYTVRLEGFDGKAHTFHGLSDAQAAEILQLNMFDLLYAVHEYGICSTQDGLAVEDGTNIEEAIRNFQEMSS